MMLQCEEQKTCQSMRTQIIALRPIGMLLIFLSGCLNAPAAEVVKASSIGDVPAGIAPKQSPVSADATPLPHRFNSNTPTYLRDVLPIFMGKCSRCHNDQTRFLQSWFDYKTALRDRSEIKRRVWDSWKGTFFKQPMPVGNSPEFE